MKASAFGGRKLAGVVGTVVVVGLVFIAGNDHTLVLAFPKPASPTPSSFHVT